MSYPTRVRYGLRLLARLAKQQPGEYASMSEIATQEGISMKYMEQIVGMLKPLGILSAVRGAKGGYALTRAPKDITLDKVFDCFGVLASPVPCLDNGDDCPRKPSCPTVGFWKKLNDTRQNFLSSITLADLVAEDGATEALLGEGCPEDGDGKENSSVF